MLSVSLIKQQYKSPALKMMGIYTVTNFFGKGLSFLLLPLFTNPKYLSAADNGLLSLFSQAIIFLMPFVSLGILQSASVDYFKLDKKNFSDFFTTGFVMVVCMTLFSLLLFFLLRNFLSKEFSFPALFIWAIPFAAFMAFCYEMIVLIVRNKDDAFTYMKINTTRIIIELVLAFLLIIFLSMKWMGRVTGILAATGSIAVYSIYFFKKNGYLSGSVKKKIIYAELKYSVPVFAMQLSIFCLSSSDSFLLAALTKNTSEVGVYGLSCVFATILITLSGALIQYFIPKINRALFAEIIDFTDIRRLFAMYVIIMFFAFLLLIICVPLVYHTFINAIYWPGIHYYYFIVTGYFFWSITVFVYAFLLYHKKKKQLLLLSSAAIIISVTSNYFFIKNMSSFGAAISVCCSYFITMLLTFITTKNIGSLHLSGPLNEKNYIIYYRFFGFNWRSRIMLVSPLQDISKSYNIILVTLYGENIFSKKYFSGDKSYCLNMKSRKHIFGAARRLTQIIKENNVTLIHSFLYWSTIVARLTHHKKIPHIFSLATMTKEHIYTHKWYSRYTQVIEKITYKKNQTVIAPTFEVLNDFDDAIGIKGQSRVIYNFVADEFFKLPSNPISLNDNLKLVAVGNLKDVKNYQLVIDAFKFLKNHAVTIDIYGDGPLKSDLEMQITDNNLPVIFKGSCQSVYEILPQYDAFVMSSFHEGFGISAAEAMAAGLPILLSDIKVFREVSDNNAVFFDPYQPESLSDAIKNILNRNTDLKKLIQPAKEMAAKNYTKEKYLQSLLQLYDEVLR